MTDLKPCPFCLSRAEHYSFNFRKHTVRCSYCLADCGEHDTPERAAFVWNTRPAEEALKAEVESLKDRLERFRKVLHDVAVMANNDDLEQIFEKCRDVLRDVYLEEKFQKSFSEILHRADTAEKGGDNE